MKQLIMALLVVSVSMVVPIGAVAAVNAQNQLESSSDDKCVILLHGMGRTNRSMKDMAGKLEIAGYVVANIDYPSTDHKVEELADMAVSDGIKFCEEQKADTIHFVTHSLGGIIIRYYLGTHVLEKLGRVVMLSPPNKGSEVTDALGDMFFYRYLFGPAGQQLGTGENSFVNKLGPVTYPVGIIIGNQSVFFDSYFSKVIPGEDDGKVSVERAKVEGMADFLVLPYTHPFIMEEEEVISQTIYFLENGYFSHDELRDSGDVRNREFSATRP